MARASLAAGLILSVLTAGGTSHAEHGADVPGYIEQAGNGAGGSAPVIPDFITHTVLFDETRFTVPVVGGPRPLRARYLAWGTFINPDGQKQLGLSQSDNGFSFDTPRACLLRRPDGVTAPFLMNGHFSDVVFVASGTDRVFAIYWFAGGLSPVIGQDIRAIHRAISVDGCTFEGEVPLAESSAGSVTTGPGSNTWKASTMGPGDVIYQPSGSTAANCAATSPWACRYVMTYSAIGDTSVSSATSTGLAGSPDGRVWTGMPNPILCPSTPYPGSVCGAGQVASWDGHTATFGRVRKLAPNTWEMYYAGGTSDVNECGDFGACWQIGVATSSDGLSWQKVTTTEPLVRPQLTAAFAPGPRNVTYLPNLVDDQRVSGTTHARVYYSRQSFGGPQPSPALARDTFLAETSPVPDVGPSIRIGQPDNGLRPRSETPIDFYLNDSFGSSEAAIGIDMTTLDVTFDGLPFNENGLTFERTIVTSVRAPAGWRVSARGENLRLPDGPHTFAVRVADLDGNMRTLSTSFTIDTKAPTTTVTSGPASPQLGFPDSPGTFVGTTTDEGSALSRMRVTVTNPLGHIKRYDSPSYGFTIEPLSSSQWNWRWVAPSLDTHFAVPGEYVFTIGGLDIAGNTEVGNTANTKRVLVL
ncbi:MAG TPA: hypothetical protein VM600_00975 [Actinomycetota bacterium]|nr:hypothetical protein [Actinomycetota bacterium]